MLNLEKWFPTEVDFRGQQLAERIYQLVVLVFGVAGWLWGYIEQKYSYTVYTTAVGALLAMLLVLPAWPIYRKHPLKWLQPSVSVTPTGADKQKSKKNK